jgi:glycine/D-amino acid oxidase-like deaminating enzyme
MTSLWLDETRNATEIYGGATHDVPNAEVVVIGAGITGLVTSVLLSRGGKRVVVVEVRTAGAVATGNTTAKVSLLQGSRLSAISQRHSVDVVRQHVEGNRQGQAWLARYCADRAIGFQREDAYSFAQFEHGLPAARGVRGGAGCWAWCGLAGLG